MSSSALPTDLSSEGAGELPAQLWPGTTVPGGRPEYMVAATAAADLAALLLSGSLALAAKWIFAGTHDFTPYVALIPLVLLFPLVYAALGLYAGVSLDSTEELRRLTLASVLVCLCLGVLTLSFRGNGIVFTWTMSLALLVSVVLVPVARVMLRFRLSGKLWWGYPALIFGTPAASDLVVRKLLANPSLGLKPVAYVGTGQACDSTIPRIPCLREPDLVPWGRESGGAGRMFYAVIVGAGGTGRQLSEVIDRHRRSFSHVLVIPDAWDYSCLWVSPKNIGGMLGLEVRELALLPHNQLLKRFLDLLLIAVCAPLLLPVLTCLAVLIRLDSPGPAFFRHRRVGRGGREFLAWKFRTMHQEADRLLERYLAADENLRAEWANGHKLKNDPRVTGVGRFLRANSLDELPQLWNVLRGEMSLVGPRPIVREEIPRYGAGFAMYARVPSGLTGLWQVSGRSGTSYAERVGFDVFYVRNWSIWLDLCILFRTIGAVLSRTGAY